MTERELRDEIESLYAELQAERAKVEESAENVLARDRAALVEEIRERGEQVDALFQKIGSTRRQLKIRTEDVARAEDELNEARSRVSGRESLGNPLEASKSNWEPQDQAGCALAFIAVMSLGLSAAVAGWLA
jgi:small-conductance mechanosensitive channel